MGRARYYMVKANEAFDKFMDLFGWSRWFPPP